MNRIAVLASGGLDSSLLVADLARNTEVFPIYVQCGLMWEAMEHEALQSFIAALKHPGVRPVTTLSVSARVMYGEHWSLSGQGIPGLEEPDHAVFLPGRNILLIGLAAVWCSTHDISRIAIGTLGGNPFPDATPEFFQDFTRILSAGLDYQVQVEAPYHNLHKSEVLRRFSGLPLELTLTCMAPKGGKHCGRCNKCGERRRAFQQAGVPDRTVYLL
ncbi:MAG: 7-cyano-7-deazaguanine synthase [Deltaproteobacteria bacterium]|nr:7-cyano-7-deazaguanine synthase [Deltaproteobacteria bacterium]